MCPNLAALWKSYTLHDRWSKVWRPAPAHFPLFWFFRERSSTQFRVMSWNRHLQPSVATSAAAFFVFVFGGSNCPPSESTATPAPLVSTSACTELKTRLLSSLLLKVSLHVAGLLMFVLHCLLVMCNRARYHLIYHWSHDILYIVATLLHLNISLSSVFIQCVVALLKFILFFLSLSLFQIAQRSSCW